MKQAALPWIADRLDGKTRVGPTVGPYTPGDLWAILLGTPRVWVPPDSHLQVGSVFDLRQLGGHWATEGWPTACTTPVLQLVGFTHSTGYQPKRIDRPRG